MNSDQRATLTTGVILVGGVLIVSKVLGKLFPDEAQPGGANVHVNPDGTEQVSTFTQPQANALADALEIAFYGTGIVTTPWEDEYSAITIMCSAQNDADVNLLMNTYGERGPALDKMTLPMALQAYLDADDIAYINGNYASKNMHSRF